MRAIGARRVVDRSGRRHPNRHASDEVVAVLGARREVPAEPEYDSVPLGHVGEELLEARTARHPEFVRVGVDHPVGAEGRRREAGHVRAPHPIVHLALHRDSVQVAITGVRLENVGRPIHRAMVGRYDEIDAEVQMVPNLRVDNVCELLATGLSLPGGNRLGSGPFPGRQTGMSETVQQA